MNDVLEHSDLLKGGLATCLIVNLGVVLVINGGAQGIHQLHAEMGLVVPGVDTQKCELRGRPCDEASSSKGIVSPFKFLKSSGQSGDVGFRHSNLSLDRCGTAKVGAPVAASSVCGGGLRPFVNAFPEAA